MLNPNRIYRAVQYRSNDDSLEEILYQGNRYKDAHFCCLQHDGDFWPKFYHIVERSLDDGATWEVYSADEMINGRPAWTYNDL
jgi:hypothetical protein